MAPIFLKAVLTIETMWELPIQFRREKQSRHLKRWFFLKKKTNPFIFTSTPDLLQRSNKLSFSSIEINKPLPALASQVRFHLRIQLYLPPQSRYLITRSAESIIMTLAKLQTSSGWSLMCCGKGVWRNFSIDWTFLHRRSIQNHAEPSITEKRRNKAKYPT